MIRVFLVDYHQIVRRAIAKLIDAQPDLAVVGEAGTFRDSIRLVDATVPDVVVVDVRFPDGNGIDLCREIRSAHPGIACIIFTGHDDDEALRSSILAGASGYVLKDFRARGLIDAVRRVAAGETVQSAAVRRQGKTAMHTDELAQTSRALSTREEEVLGLVADGLTNREISERLGFAEDMVKNDVSGLLVTLGVGTR
jgi:DNA-binding NarL/FixJ family response regulator